MVQVQEPAAAGRRGVGRLVEARQEVVILVELPAEEAVEQGVVPVRLVEGQGLEQAAEEQAQVEELREAPEAAILEPEPSHSPRKTTKWRLLGIQGISTISRPCSG